MYKIKLLFITLLVIGCSDDVSYVKSMYQALSIPENHFKEPKFVAMKAYYSKSFGIPRLFVSKQDAEINNYYASFLLVSEKNIDRCENSYIYLEGYMGRYKDNLDITVFNIQAFISAHLPDNVDTAVLADANNGVYCSSKK